MRIALNKWVLRNEVGGVPTGVYTGLCLADTQADAEQWMDELGLEGTLLTREQYEQTPQGADEKAQLDARRATERQAENAEAARINAAAARNRAKRAG